MNKRFSIALLVLFSLGVSAVSSLAVEVVEKDDFSYEIKGDWQIQLRQDPGVDQELDVEYDDLEIKNVITYKIDEKLTAFGEVHFGFKDAADEDGDPQLEEAFVGLTYRDVSLIVGKTNNAADEFGVEEAYETIVAEDAFDEVGTLDGDDMIKVEAKIGSIKLVASHEVSSESEDSGNEEFTDVFLGTEIAGFEIGAVYQVYEDDVLSPTSDVTAYGFSLMYDADVVAIGADYSEAEDDLAPANDQSVINAVVIVPVNKSTEFVAGYVSQDFDAAAATDIDGWYANVTHKLNKKVSVFAEIEDDDQDNSDMGYMAGLRLKF